MLNIFNRIVSTKFFVVLILALMPWFNCRAQEKNLKKLMTFAYQWKFSIGDNSNWASPSFNDSNWETIKVPGNWESQGYNGYDGYAWYRTHFEIEVKPNTMPLYLFLGYIDDVDEVYINGTSVGKSGSFPPFYSTAYNAKRVYQIPMDVLHSGSENTLAIKIFDEGGEGGIIHGEVGIFMDIDALTVDFNLQGKWKFSTGNCQPEEVNDLVYSKWPEVQVPGVWENQGFKDYDGYACYATEFELNNQFLNQPMVLVLGRIDDFDQVYLNGKLVGQSINFKKESTSNYSYSYKQMRGYYLPTGALNNKGKNLLVVKVLDTWGDGGIYEGSVGLITQNNYINYWKARRNKSPY